MNDFFYMFGFLGALMPLAVLYLLFSHFKLKRRVSSLEARLVDQQSAPATAPKPQTITPEPITSTSGPWVKPEGADQPPPETASAQPRAFVFRKDKLETLALWLRENWFLAVAALSLALSGVFLVQYGVEHGVLTPFWRVMGALGLGAALIAAGEFLRRRFGDDVGGGVDYLPSTFAGAGLFSLFAGILSARQLYDLIDAGTALAGLVVVAALTVVLGWFYGPLLAAVGILGAVIAPFVVGGSSDAPELFYYYFALVAVAGLLVDAYKRWAWISALVLIASFAGAFLLFADGTAPHHYLVFALLLMAAAAIIPPLSLQPQHGGTTLLGAFLGKLAAKKDARASVTWPEFPTRIASGAFLAACLATFLVATDYRDTTQDWLAISAFGVLFLAATLWMWKAPALDDLALWPALGFITLVFMQGDSYGPLYQSFSAPLAPEAALPKTATILVVLALIGSALAFWRSRFSNRHMTLWGAGAAALAPVVVVALEVEWSPARVLGAGNWALHAMVVAALMVLFAERSYRGATQPALRTALFAMSALTMISLALMLMLSAGALTLALAVTVLVAALIDRRFNLAALALFVQIGTVVLGWRLIADPGLYWAFERASLWDLLLVFVGTIALLAATWAVLKHQGRKVALVTVESAIWTFTSVLATTLIYRAMGSDIDNHLGVSLVALVWLISMINQMYRMKSGGRLRWLRGTLAALFGLLALVCLGLAATIFNPLTEWNEPVMGPPVFDSLLLALVPIAAVFAVAAWKLAHFSQRWRRSFMVLSALFAALYVGLEIRRLWQGPNLSSPTVEQGELYSYTIAMLLVSVALLFFAFSRRSVGLRKLAIAGIGLTIAKVFLIDMSGLTGLVRVASFLGLGLSLAGLAWVNRSMTQQWTKGQNPDG